ATLALLLLWLGTVSPLPALAADEPDPTPTPVAMSSNPTEEPAWFHVGGFMAWSASGTLGPLLENEFVANERFPLPGVVIVVANQRLSAQGDRLNLIINALDDQPVFQAMAELRPADALTLQTGIIQVPFGLDRSRSVEEFRLGTLPFQAVDIPLQSSGVTLAVRPGTWGKVSGSVFTDHYQIASPLVPPGTFGVGDLELYPAEDFTLG